MFRRLRNRLLFLNMMIISIVMIVAFSVIYFITYTSIQKENQSKLASMPTLPRVAFGSTDFHDPQRVQDSRIIMQRIPVDYSQSFIILTDNGGQVMDVFSYIDLQDESYHKIAEKTWNTGKINGTVSFENRKWQYHISTFKNRVLVSADGEMQVIGGEGYYQISFLDISDSSKTLTQLLITFVLVGSAMLVILFGISVLFANRSIHPIEDYWQKQKQFVADASHELKTPLAIIGANADALLTNGEETVNSQKKWIGYIQAEAGRMGKLVNDMLYLAKVEDAGADQIPLDLSKTVLDVIASMEVVIFEKGINLTQVIEPGLTVRGDGEKIKRAVLILLDNATKYTNAYGSICITLKRVKNHAVFSVQNSGEGIPADKLPRVFDRFYRCDPARVKETDGYGLGLSIAKAVIERSGGSIYAESTESSTTFTFELKMN